MGFYKGKPLILITPDNIMRISNWMRQNIEMK